MKKNYLNPEKITIEIGADEQKQKKRGNGKKSILPTRREDSILARRNKPPTGINFYDFSYLKTDGIFGNLPFVSAQSSITVTDHSNLIDLILENELSAFKHIENGINDFSAEFQADGYFPFNPSQIRVSGDSFTYYIVDSLRDEGDSNFNRKWTANGLKLSPAELAETVFEIGGTALKGDDKAHITATLDYEAAAAAFSPSAIMDIFVVPKIYIADGYSVYFTVPGGLEVSNAATPYRIIPFGTNAWDKAHSQYRKYYSASWQAGGQNNQIQDYWNAYEAAQTLEYYGIGRSNLIPGAGFPPPPADPYGDHPTGDPFALYLNTTESEVINILLFIIRQNNNLFYVWS